MEPETTPKRVIHQPDHGADDFSRRVVRAGLLPQIIVIDREEVLVKVQPRIGLVLADRRPVDGIEDTRERAERGLQRRLVRGVIG